MNEELNNDGRADFAATALAAYHDVTRPSSPGYGDEDSEQFAETFSDLLGDLQHLAKRAGADFQELLERGTYHFEEEVQEEAEVARWEAERIRQENAPIDEKVYAAITDGDDFEKLSQFKKDTDLTEMDVRWALLRLKEQGRIELVEDKGWRRVASNG